MNRNVVLAVMIVALFAGSLWITGDSGEGQYVDKFNGTGGLDWDYVNLRGSGMNLYDSHLYIELEKNVPISTASMKISTVNTETGPWIHEPAVDVGLDDTPEWKFAGTGYGDFGRVTSFSDESDMRTNTYSGSQNKALGSMIIPAESTVHQGGMTVRGRFEPTIPSLSTLSSGGSISYTPSYIRIGELTGDALNDTLLSTGRPGWLYLYKQTTEKNFDGSRLTAISSSVYDFLIFDVDQDKDNDIVYSTSSGLYWTQNSGTGTFSGTYSITTSFIPSLLELADMDGDGNDEIIMGKQTFYFSSSQNAIMMAKRSSGTSFDIWPVYDTGTGSGAATLNFLKVGDWNDDDYIDVFTALSNNKVYVYENPANKSYYNDTTSISTKARWDDTQVISESYTIYGFDVGDVDKDGNADVVLAPYTYYGASIYYYRNRGTSSWSRYSLISGYVYYPRSVTLADISGDGYLDAFYSVGNYYYNNRVGWLDSKKNPNKNYWSNTNVLSGQTVTGTECFSGDLNSDGYWDVGLFFTTNKQTIVYYNDDPYDGSKLSPGYIEDGGLVGLSDLEHCDVDQDGDVDFLITAYTSGTVGWFENDGSPFSGSWDFHRINGIIVSGAKEVGWGDIDGDSDIDVAVSSYDSHQVMWFENTGDPKSIWEYHNVGRLNYPFGIGVADFDDDGIMEIVASAGYYYRDGIRCFYTSDPTGSWNSFTIANSVSYCGRINITDMNRDGHLDIIVPVNGWSGVVNIYRNPMPSNPKSTSWAAIGAVSGLSYPQEAVPIDIDNDGNLDVVSTANYGGVKWGKAPRNANSTGGWQTYDIVSSLTYPYGVEVDDVDNDGFADVFVTSKYMWDYSWAYGQGLYWFEEEDDPTSPWERRTLDSSTTLTSAAAVADLNEDNVTEIFTISYNQNHFKVSRPTLNFPSNIEIDLGNDGNVDWTWPGTLRGTTDIDFGTQLQSVITNRPSGVSVTRDAYGNNMMTIPIYLKTSTKGRLTGWGIQATYNVTFSIDNGGKLKEAISRIIPDYSDPNDPQLRIYVLFSGKSEGSAKIFDVKLEYNAPPKLIKALPTELTVQEDSMKRNVLDLSKFFQDDYDQPNMLNYQAYMTGYNSDKVNVFIEKGANVSIDSTITKDFDREAYVRFIIKDNGGPGGVPPRQFVTKEIRIDVTPVDDPPVLSNGTLPPKLKGYEGTEVQVLDLSKNMYLFSDPDDPMGYNIRYYAVLDPDGTYPLDLSAVNVRISDKKVYISSEGDWYGENIPLRIYGYDDISVNLNDDPYHMTSIDILNINDAPVFEEMPDVYMKEDTPQDGIIDLSPYASDIDTPPLDLKYSIIRYTNSTHMTVKFDTRDRSKINVEPGTANWHGIVDVELEVTDGEYTDSSSFRIHVEPINDRPRITIKYPLEDRAYLPGEFSIVGEAYDVEGIEKVEVLFQDKWYEALGKNTWGVTVVAPDFGVITENVPIQVRLTDLEGETAFSYVNITILKGEEPLDDDWDNDTYKNTIDKFPLDPSEWADSDNDGYGDNTDDFPFHEEWYLDSDQDGIADEADDYPFDPTNRPVAEIEVDDDGTGPDLTIPIILIVIALLLLVAAVLSLVMFINKRNASLDPRKTIVYYNKMEKRRERIRKLTGRDSIENLLEKMQLKDVKTPGLTAPRVPGIPMPLRAGPGLPQPASKGQPMPVQRLPPPPQAGGRMPPPPPRVPPMR
jgi:hypothetical protein